MAEIVGVRFRKVGKIYYFDPAGIELEAGDRVIVKTSRGQEMGQVIVAPTQVSGSEITEPLKAVVRKAEPEDVKCAEELETKAEEALAECGKQVEELNLSMKLLSAEYNFDSSRLTILFSAE